MFDIYAALSGGMIANLLLTILGLVISVAAGILLYWKVFGPKAKDPSAGKFMQYANGQRFLPLCIVKITYYSLAAFLVFIGIAKCITTIDGFGAIFKYVIVGNVVLRILFETVLAVRKNAGIDTDNKPQTSRRTASPHLSRSCRLFLISSPSRLSTHSISRMPRQRSLFRAFSLFSLFSRFRFSL